MSGILFIIYGGLIIFRALYLLLAQSPDTNLLMNVYGSAMLLNMDIETTVLGINLIQPK